MRYIGDGQPVGLDIIAEKIPEWIALYEKQKYGLMALVLKETNELIGFCGFIKCAVKPRPSGRGYKAQSVKEGFVAVEYTA